MNFKPVGFSQNLKNEAINEPKTSLFRRCICDRIASSFD